MFPTDSCGRIREYKICIFDAISFAPIESSISFTSKYNLSNEQLIGMSVEELSDLLGYMDPKTGEYINLYNLFKTREMVVHQKFDRSQASLSLQISPVCDSKGRVCKYILTEFNDSPLRNIQGKECGFPTELQEEILNNLDCIVTINDDISGSFLYVNNAFEEKMGYTREEAAELTFIDISSYHEIHPQERAIDLINKTVLGEIQTFEWQGKTKDGKVFWADLTLKPIQNNGRTYIMAIGRDITDSKENRIKMEKSSLNYKLLFEGLPMGIVSFDKEGNIIDINRQGLSILGSPSKEKTKEINLFNFPLLEKFGITKDLKIFLEKTRNMIPSDYEDGKFYESEYFYKSKWGREIYFQSRTIPIPQGAIAVFYDVTKQKTAEIALKESEERYRKLVELSPDSIIVCSRDIISYANPASCAFFGVKDVKELTGKSLLEFAHPNHVESYREWITGLSEGEKLSPRCLTMRKKNRRMMEVYTTPIRFIYNGEPSIIFIGHDITERNKIERELLRANQELNDFAYRVSHDLKTPIINIKGFLNAIREEPEIFDDYYQRVIDQSNHLLRFIDRLLELSRAGKIIDDRQNFNIENLINRIFLINRMKTTKCRLSLVNLPAQIYGAPKAMEQVFLNLIQNSFRYRDENKEEILIEISCETVNGDYLIKYSDNGIGVEKKNLDKIFNLGFTNGSKSGTGFGLAIVKKIIDAHRGRIRLESPGPGHGVTFHIQIPAKDPEKSESH